MLLIALAVLAQVASPSPSPSPHRFPSSMDVPVIPKWEDIYYKPIPGTTNKDWLYADLIARARDTTPKPLPVPLPPHREIGLVDWVLFRSSSIRSYNIALDNAGNGEWENAVRYFGEAVEKWRSFAEAEYGLGVSYHQIDQPALARLHWITALRIKPGYVEAVNALSRRPF